MANHARMNVADKRPLRILGGHVRSWTDVVAIVAFFSASYALVSCHIEYGQYAAEMRAVGGLHEADGLLGINNVKFEGPDFTDEKFNQIVPTLNALKVHSVSLANTRVTPEGFAHLGRLKSLRHLIVHGAMVNDAHLAAIDKTPRLAALDFSSTSISDNGLIHLAPHTGLVTLRLNDTEITDACIPTLSRMSTLRWLDLVNTSITPAGIQQLERELPKCKISFKTARDATSSSRS